MSTERDELATVIETAYDLNPGMASFELLAHAVLAAGYRKPPTIENDKLLIKDGLLLLDVGGCTCTSYGSSHEPHCGLEYLDDLTKPLERAGYTKPRTITTSEELDALGKGSVVLDADGDSFQFDGDFWRLAGYGDNFRSHEVPFPATVLHEGNAA